MSFKLFLTILKKIFLAPFALVTFILVLIVMLIFAPFVIYRRIIFYLAPIFRPDLGKMLTLPAYVLACEDLTSYPSATCVGELFVNGPVDLEEYKKAVTERLLEARRKSGELMAPEMRQYPTQWLGHLFWKSEDNFKIDEHVVEWDSEGMMDDLKMKEIKKQIMVEPFEEGRALWKNYIIRKRVLTSGEVHTSIIVKFHHCIADGYSVMKIFFKVFDGTFTPPSVWKTPEETPSTLKSVLLWIGSIFIIPFEVFEFFAPKAQVLLPDSWNNSIPSLQKIREINPNEFALGISPKIPIEQLKNISRSLNVSLTSLLVGIYGGAIGKYMKNRNHPKILPKVFYITCPTPLSYHPDGKLRNFAMLTTLNLRVNEMDPIKRIKLNQEELRRATNPLIQIPLLAITLHFASIPIPIMKLVKRLCKGKIPVAYSCVPGAKEEFFWNGNSVEFLDYSLPSFRFGIPLIISSLTWCGNIKFTLSGSLQIFPNDGAMDELLGYFLEEIDKLTALTV